MKSWYVLLIIAAMFNIAQYVSTGIVVAWLFIPIVLFCGLTIWAAWFEGRAR